MGKTANAELRMPGGLIQQGYTRVWKVVQESQRAPDDKGWVHQCGANVQGVEVMFSVHDGPMPGWGRGEVHRETIPFCPDCEFVPALYGILVVGDNVEAKYQISAAAEQPKLKAIKQTA